LKYVYRALAGLCFLIGIIGIVIPGLPTVPLMLLSAWFASLGWPAFERWLLNHPKYGPHIINWRTSRAIPRKAKWASSIFMGISGILIWLSSALMIIQILVTITLFVVGVWIWTRNEPETDTVIN